MFMSFLVVFINDINTNDKITIDLWTVVGILVIIALLIYIFRLRR